MNDTIEIRRLRVPVRIGVPAEERADEQTLWVSVVLAPSQGIGNTGDEISRTIDYAVVAEQIKSLGSAKDRKLIETFACEIAEMLLGSLPLMWAEVLIEKHILPDTECVAVKLRRFRST